MKRLPCWCPKPISGSRTLFLCKLYLLVQQICIDAGHVSENTIWLGIFDVCNFSYLEIVDILFIVEDSD